MAPLKTELPGDKLAKIVSAVFHPVFMPLYGLIIIFSAPTILYYIPFGVKKILFTIIILNNVILPLSMLPYFRYRNIISSWSVENRKERIVPLITTSFFYSVTLYIIYRFHIPVFIKAFTISSVFLAIGITLISLKYKISIHSAGAGSLTALVLSLSFEMQTLLLWFLIPVILFSGLVMTARLWLKAHSQDEVYAGFLLGFFITGMFLLLFR